MSEIKYKICELYSENDYHYFECGFVAGLNYQRLKALEKLSELDQEMGLQ